MMVDRVEAIVVGAGVVGLAVARRLALDGRPPVIVEGEAHFGRWTSSRNSEVVHAGIYYSQDSLKSRLCVAGKEMLYAFCEDRGVRYNRMGKLIFAYDAGQLSGLDSIISRARGSGVDDLEMLDRAQARMVEPALNCAGALLSPSTGIVDSHGLMQALLADAEAHHAQLVTHSRVARVTFEAGLWHLWLYGTDEAVLAAPVLVNSAGLTAHELAAKIESLDPVYVPDIHYARGSYFNYSGKVPFSRLIYPLPEPGGLGTHLTLDMAGQARFGPDIEWVDSVDYTVDPTRKNRFALAAARFWPAIDPDRLHPGYAGVRSKLSGPGEPDADFVISGPSHHGCDGLVNLFGIESPGLTASLAIADRVADELR